MSVRVMVGSALDVLRTLPDASVQLVCTSPPYFGLRAYGTEPQVWGGDPGHGHEWDETIRRQHQPNTSAASTLNPCPAKDNRVERGNGDIRQAFCPCGAWRGELGSEPTPGLFIEHLVSIFDEVWRVLRKDGLVFCNLGDSYSGSGKGPTGHNGIGDQGERQGFVGAPNDSAPETTGLNAAPGYRVAFRIGRAYVNQKRGSIGAGIPAKNLLLIPQRFAIAMQERGWIVRSEIAWAKTSAMPESVRDRPTSAWEPIWMFAKQARYFYDGDAVRQPNTDATIARHARSGVESPSDHAYSNGRHGLAPHRGSLAISGGLGMEGGRALGANLRNVWTLGPSPFADAHFATFPPEIPRRCILAGTSDKGACPACGSPWGRVVERGRYGSRNDHTGRYEVGNRQQSSELKGANYYANYRPPETTGWQQGCSCPPAPPRPCVVLDPFGGSGTTGLVADRLGRDAVLVELNPEYARMAEKRIAADAGTLFGEPVTVEAPVQAALFGDEAAS